MTSPDALPAGSEYDSIDLAEVRSSGARLNVDKRVRTPRLAATQRQVQMARGERLFLYLDGRASFDKDELGQGSSVSGIVPHSGQRSGVARRS